MGMTPYQFFEAFVEPNFEDCFQHPGCVRRAFNAAVSASHLADHYFTYFESHDPSKIKGFKSLGKFVECLSHETDGCFRDIRSISNAYKHLYTSKDPKKAVHSSVSSTLAIESIELTDEDAEIKKIEEECPQAKTDNSLSSEVMYTKKDGEKLNFLSTLDKVVKYWDKKLK